MPLLRKRPYDPDLGLPPGVSPEDGLWVVRFTGEVFADYGAYLRKQQLYARRGWSCKYTGRSGLTYEEALVSEERAKRAHGQFPECFEGPVLRLVHHSTLRPDELCHRVLTHFRNNFVPGEEVLGMRGEKPEPCRILNSLGADDGEDVAADLLNPVAGLDQKYEVEWLDGEGGSDVSIVSRGQLSRVKDKHPISRPMLKTWLERVVHCESTGVKGAPFLWRAKRELAEKCNLPEALPQDLEMKLQKAAQRTLATKKKAKKTKLEGDNKKQRAPAARPGPCKPTENGATCTRAPLGHSGSVHPPAEAGASGRAREGASNGLQTPKSVERPKKKRKTTPSEPKKVAERPQAAPSAEPSPSSSPIPGTPVQAEALEDTDRRLSAGSLKRAVFEILKGVGPYGASTTYLLQRLRDRNMNREVTDSKSAKSCVASTLAHDLAFVRVAHGHFAIRAFTKATTQEGGTGGSSRPGGGAAKMGQCTLGGEEPVVHLKIERQRFDRNSSKCSKCHKGLNQELPVLVLCDFCPRAYHVGCLRGQLPPYGDWACPKCIDKRESTVRKMKNMEESREERQLKKIAEREERERRRLEEREERERQRVREREERERAKEEARQKARYPIEDMEVLEEEKAKLASLEVAAAAAPDLASPGTPTTAHADAPRSLQQQQALVEGPRDQAPIMEGEAQLAGLMDGLAVVEFLSTFREECEVKALGLPELNHTVAWPLDGDSLAELYMALLRCVLLDQVGQTGMARSRARRWARVVDHATWPEVLRRYLLASREAQGVAKVDVRDTAVEFMDDHQIAQRAAEDLGSSPFYLLGPRYHLRLLHALCNDIINCSAMKDEVMGRLEETIQLCAEKYHADAEKRRLERQRKMQMKEGRKKREAAEQHQGEANNDAKKEQPQEAVKEVQGAQDVKEEVKEDVKEEVKEDVKEEVGQEATASEAQGDGAEGGETPTARGPPSSTGLDAGDGLDPGGGGEAEGSTQDKAGGTPDAEADVPTTAGPPEQDAVVDGKDANARRREFEHRLELGKRAIRTEPLGLDREHRRYWWLKGDRSAVYVESPDGKSLGAINTVEDLDDVMGRLNKRGIREAALLTSLQTWYGDICASLSPQESVLDACAVPRHPQRRFKGGRAPRPVEALEADTARGVLRSALSHVDALVSGLSNQGVRVDGGLKDWRKRFRSVETVGEVCQLLLYVESFVGVLAQGLPRGADDESLGLVPATADAAEKGLDGDDGEGSDDGDEDSGDDLVSALDELDNSETDESNGAEAPSAGARNRRHSLWRSAGERGVWVRGVKAAECKQCGSGAAYMSAVLKDRAQPLIEKFKKQKALVARGSGSGERPQRGGRSSGRPSRGRGASGGGVERGGTAQRVARRSRRSSRGGEVEAAGDRSEAVGGSPFEEGELLMGRPQTRSYRLKFKVTMPVAHGASPSGASSSDGGSADEGGADGSTAPSETEAGADEDDRWDYTCLVCKQGGEMLCCEGPCCTVAMHPECTEVGKVPEGSWFCPTCTTTRLQSRPSKTRRR